MKANITVHHGGKAEALTADLGVTVAEALYAGGVSLSRPCGGKGICGKCRVRASGKLSPLSESEKSVLKTDVSQGFRLGCAARIEGDAEIYLDENKDFNIVSGSSALRPMASCGRNGIATDIGTTTLSAQLYCRDGRLYTKTAKNPQSAFGADVISRIGASLEGRGDELQRLIASELEHLWLALCEQAEISPADITDISVAGNTAMLYILTGKSPKSLAYAPFEADCLFGFTLKPCDIGISSFKNAEVYLPDCLSAFVGADITVGISACGMTESDKTALLVDIGTNGEIALWHGGTLYCCSTAAGPAFEGTGIAMGMQGTAGAVDKVFADSLGKIGVHVIGDLPAKGICGSGVLDAAALLAKIGAIDENGTIDDECEACEIAEYNDETAVKLCAGVYFTQKDIRMVQLAKSAICAGISVLAKKAGIAVSDIEHFYIAGGFGYYLNLDNAADIGLFPKALKGKAAVLGNSAQAGAALTLFRVKNGKRFAKYQKKQST